MNKYYFTFNSHHFTKEGESMEGCYITVEAFNWEQARSLFLNHFMAKEMNSLTDFCYQYDAVEFADIAQYYPNGEYKHLVLLELNEA